jgi:hypothetical protein
VVTLEELVTHQSRSEGQKAFWKHQAIELSAYFGRKKAERACQSWIAKVGEAVYDDLRSRWYGVGAPRALDTSFWEGWLVEQVP